ncbi:hypothetical protein [Nocardia tengchongensis]|uniref:hypothetical protein n=1 Tax=Nocardia tengchongensis TaxID=2055889 RepID=UPI003656D3BC
MTQADRTITTITGTTVTLADRDGGTVVLLDDPASPPDMRATDAGQIIGGGFQPAPFAAWALRPGTLRAIAELIERHSDGQ